MWLNQLEPGRATWEDEEEKVRFRHALVWHPVTSASSADSTSVVSVAKKQPKQAFTYTAPVRTVTKACKATPTNSMCVPTAWPWSTGPLKSMKLVASTRRVPPLSVTLGYSVLKDIS